MNGSKISKLGKISHISDLGHIIIKNPPKLPKINSNVVNEKMVHIGIVSDIFGPVSSPYVSIKTKRKKTNIDEKMILYSIKPRRKRRSRRS